MSAVKKLSKSRTMSRTNLSTTYILKEHWRKVSNRISGNVPFLSTFVNKHVTKAAKYLGFAKLIDAPHTEEMVVHQMRLLCRDYIFFKLRDRSLLQDDIYPPGLKVQDIVSACHPEGHSTGCGACDVSRELISMTQEFDRMYPYLFRDVCSYLRVNFQTGAQIQTVFTSVASEIFRRSVTWARVLALFAFAGTLVVECVEHGHVNYANVVVDTMQKFTRRRLATWIVKQGGWPALVYHLERYRVSSARLWCISIVGGMFGIALTVGFG